MATSSSQIFCPYRAIGFFSNHVPLVCQSQGSDSVVVTSVGKSFHVYKVSHILKILEFCMIMLLISMQCDKLKLIFVGMCAYLVSIAINRYFFSIFRHPSAWAAGVFSNSGKDRLCVLWQCDQGLQERSRGQRLPRPWGVHHQSNSIWRASCIHRRPKLPQDLADKKER